MKIPKGAVTSLMSEGRITLQVPMVIIKIDPNYVKSINKSFAQTIKDALGLTANLPKYNAPTITDDDYEEAPNEWFVELKSNKRPCVGKQQGFTYLSEEGWNKNKNKIKKAFIGSGDKMRGTWKDFEKYVAEHFAEVELQKKKLKDKLKRELEELK